jgi:hypothetical protein
VNMLNKASTSKNSTTQKAILRAFPKESPPIIVRTREYHIRLVS